MEELQEASLEMLVELARPTSHDTVLDYASGAGIAGFAVAADVRHVEAADELPDTLDEGERLAGELGLVNVAFTLPITIEVSSDYDKDGCPYDQTWKHELSHARAFQKFFYDDVAARVAENFFHHRGL